MGNKTILSLGDWGLQIKWRRPIQNPILPLLSQIYSIQIRKTDSDNNDNSNWDFFIELGYLI